MIGFYLVAALIIFAVLYLIQNFVASLLLKLITITWLFIIASGVYFSFDTYKGWPTSDSVGPAYLIHAVGREPRGSDPGAIYVMVFPEPQERSWLDRVMNYREESTPRLHVLPYTDEQNKRFRNAMERMEEGYLVRIVDGDSGEGEGGVESTNGSSGNSGNSGEGTGGATDNAGPRLEYIPPDEIFQK